jgi:hypothetical protein
MNKVTLDPELRSKLDDLDSEFEVCDESGRTLGYYLPAERHRKLLYALARSQVSDEELAQAQGQLGGRSLAEILADLDSA